MKWAGIGFACLATGTGLLTGSGVALGQGNKLEEIVVVAPRAVTRTVVGRTSTGGKVEEISLTRHVPFADLDLSRHADVMELEKRVADVAKESCEQLAKLYPLSPPDAPDCVKAAQAGAKDQMDKAVAAAAKHGP
jgi:UrcA family protein